MKNLFFFVLLSLFLWGCSGALVTPQVGQNSDQDGDRIPDSMDRCPDSPPNIPVGSDGCALDSDLDGVFDYLDRCPATPVSFPVDLQGCPLDTDHDGVPDGRDKCPETESAVRIDSNGCPLPKAEEKVSAIPPKLELQVLFQTGQSVLLPDNEKEFQRGIDFIRQHPHSKVIIEGHTDSVGPAAFNQKLAKNRARVVSQELAVRLGQQAPEMQVVGIGEGQPIADNSTQQGRARNRRVVIRIASE